jgi:hypothetical protein
MNFPNVSDRSSSTVLTFQTAQRLWSFTVLDRSWAFLVLKRSQTVENVHGTLMQTNRPGKGQARSIRDALTPWNAYSGKSSSPRFKNERIYVITGRFVIRKAVLISCQDQVLIIFWFTLFFYLSPLCLCINSCINSYRILCLKLNFNIKSNLVPGFSKIFIRIYLWILFSFKRHNNSKIVWHIFTKLFPIKYSW